jgi:hypothetical protein
MVKIGLYRLWLNLSDTWEAYALMIRTETAVNNLKEEVRIAKRRRSAERTERRRAEEKMREENQRLNSSTMGAGSGVDVPRKWSGSWISPFNTNRSSGMAFVTPENGHKHGAGPRLTPSSSSVQMHGHDPTAMV